MHIHFEIVRVILTVSTRSTPRPKFRLAVSVINYSRRASVACTQYYHRFWLFLLIFSYYYYHCCSFIVHCNSYLYDNAHAPSEFTVNRAPECVGNGRTLSTVKLYDVGTAERHFTGFPFKRHFFTCVYKPPSLSFHGFQLNPNLHVPSPPFVQAFFFFLLYYVCARPHEETICDFNHFQSLFLEYHSFFHFYFPRVISSRINSLTLTPLLLCSFHQ